MIIFGEKKKKVKYRTRRAVYGVFLENGKIAVINVNNTFFLPGGGINFLESEKKALKREYQEELGWDINVESKIGTATEYFCSRRSGIYLKGISSFYIVSKNNIEYRKVEQDHILYWLDPTEIDKLNFQYFKWAVKKVLIIYLHNKK